MKTFIILLFKVFAALANNQSFEDIPFLSDIDNTPLNLKDIIDVNKRIEPLSNYCGLRIIGGVDGDLNFLPYQVCLASLTYGAYSCNCGGALITLEYVITAAHCLSHPKLPHYSKFKVIAGSLRSNYLPADFNTTKDDEQYRRIDKIYLHNNYEDTLFRNDIAVFRVHRHFKKTAKVQPVRLHTTNNQVLLREGTNCLVSGYGITDEGTPSKTLRMVCVPLITKSSCRRMIASEFLTSSNFCAGVFGKDSCLGDSGGPIVCQGVLVGLVSFGGKCGVHPGVYTRLLSYTAPDLANLVDDGIASSSVKCHVVLWANVFFVNFYTILFTLSVF